MKISRKDFLKYSGSVAMSGLALASVLKYIQLNNARNPLTAATGAQSDHFFLVIGVAGGMDCTLGLDPQILKSHIDEKDLFLEYRPEDIMRSGKLAFGPSAKSLLPHAADIAIINGVNSIRDSGHESAYSYALSGSMSGSLGHHALSLAKTSGETPFGTLSNSIINFGKSYSPVTDIEFIANKLNSSDSDLYIAGLSNFITEELKSKALALAQVDKQIKASYQKLKNYFPDVEPTFNTMAACFKNNVSTTGFLSIEKHIKSINMDSHSNHPQTHLNSQKQAWDLVAEIFNIFKKTEYKSSSLFDHTTFVVLTEFSRLPFLNGSQGKDHNPFTNSVLFAGKNVKGNTIIGESQVWSRRETMDQLPTHVGLPIDFSTGLILRDINEARTKGNLILNENIASTILSLGGISALPTELKEFSPITNIIRNAV